LYELNRLLNILEEFEVGKQSLIQIRSSEEVSRWMKREIEEQINRNGQYKANFEKIMGELRTAFQAKLSTIENKKIA